MHHESSQQSGIGRLALVAWIFVLVVGLAVAWAVYKSLTPPSDRYAVTGTFPTCPDRPSCVSSVDSDAVHAIEALKYCGDAAEVPATLATALQATPGFHTLEGEDNYLHAVFVTPTMRYRDDLELLVRDDGSVDVRSVSRVGYRDFGVNRERVEDLRARFAAVNDCP